MSSSDVQKYLLAVSAACFIGIGSGFLSLSQYMFERDKEAAKLSIEFEVLTDIKIDRKTDCENSGHYKERCMYALYLHKSNEGIMKAVEFIADCLKWIGLVSLGIVSFIEIRKKNS